MNWQTRRSSTISFSSPLFSWLTHPCVVRNRGRRSHSLRSPSEGGEGAHCLRGGQHSLQSPSLTTSSFSPSMRPPCAIYKLHPPWEPSQAQQCLEEGIGVMIPISQMRSAETKETNDLHKVAQLCVCADSTLFPLVPAPQPEEGSLQGVPPACLEQPACPQRPFLAKVCRRSRSFYRPAGEAAS